VLPEDAELDSYCWVKGEVSTRQGVNLTRPGLGKSSRYTIGEKKSNHRLRAEKGPQRREGQAYVRGCVPVFKRKGKSKEGEEGAKATLIEEKKKVKLGGEV